MKPIFNFILHIPWKWEIPLMYVHHFNIQPLNSPYSGFANLHTATRPVLCCAVLARPGLLYTVEFTQFILPFVCVFRFECSSFEANSEWGISGRTCASSSYPRISRWILLLNSACISSDSGLTQSNIENGHGLLQLQEMELNKYYFGIGMRKRTTTGPSTLLQL